MIHGLSNSFLYAAKHIMYMFSVIKRFIKRNKVVFILFSIAASITLSYYITYDMPEIIPGIEKWYKLSSDLSIGVIINFIFYVFQVYIPRREEEQSTLLIIESDLIKICDRMQEILLVMKTYLPGFDSGRVQVTENSVYYLKMTAADATEGWARHFDLYRDFKPMKKTIIETTDRLLSSSLIQGCDKEIIELLAQLQRNGFLRALEIAEKDKYDPLCRYDDLEKCYPDFCMIFDQLKMFVSGHKIRFIRPLTQTEIAFFQAKISSVSREKEGVPHVYIKHVDDESNIN